MKLWIMILSLFLVSCATTAPKKTVEDMVAPQILDPAFVEGLSYADLLALDKSVFLVETRSQNLRAHKEKYKKSSIIVVNEKYKQRTALNMPLINLKYWLKKQLNSKEYLVEGYLHGKTPIAVLVQYGQMPLQNTKGLDLKVRYIRLTAIDYQEYKKNKSFVPLWEGQVSSVGPKATAEEVMGVLGAFLDKVIENGEVKRYLLPSNDPLLDKTKDVPASVVIDDLKPSLEELEFFN